MHHRVTLAIASSGRRAALCCSRICLLSGAREIFDSWTGVLHVQQLHHGLTADQQLGRWRADSWHQV